MVWGLGTQSGFYTSPTAVVDNLSCGRLCACGGVGGAIRAQRAGELHGSVVMPITLLGRGEEKSDTPPHRLAVARDMLLLSPRFMSELLGLALSGAVPTFEVVALARAAGA